jgi:hypothetical protein
MWSNFHNKYVNQKSFFCKNYFLPSFPNTFLEYFEWKKIHQIQNFDIKNGIMNYGALKKYLNAYSHL